MVPRETLASSARAAFVPGRIVFMTYDEAVVAASRKVDACVQLRSSSTLVHHRRQAARTRDDALSLVPVAKRRYTCNC